MVATSQKAVNKLHGKEGGTNPKHKPQEGQQNGVSANKKQNNPRRNPIIAVEQSHHIEEVNVQQRKPHATNAAKKDTTLVYADLWVRMSKSIRYKCSQQQHSTRTVFTLSIQQ